MYARRRARRRATLEKKGGEARNREREERKMERIGKGRREWRERGGVVRGERIVVNAGAKGLS